MGCSDPLPESIKQLHLLLEPYIHERKETLRIRKIISAHLNPQTTHKDVNSKSHPLSLVEPTDDTSSLPSAIRGIRKEYARCLRANSKARKQYEELTRGRENVAKHPTVRTTDSLPPETSLDIFLKSVKCRRKYDRLLILNDYFNTLEKQPAAALDYLEPKSTLQDLPEIPRAPLDVIHPSGTGNMKRTDLKQIADRLEKSVLNAKVSLKKEQKLLSMVSLKGSTGRARSDGDNTARLQALGITRNELINWIETELGKAGDIAPSDDDIVTGPVEGLEVEDIQTQLTLIQKQYARYNIARQSLINAATRSIEHPSLQIHDDNYVLLPANGYAQATVRSSYVVAPYLKDMMRISNEQKSFIQQRSYLAISLAKQIKESGQGLDRLAEESHLLSAHPTSARDDSKRKGSFGEEMLNSEKPERSQRARAWDFSSQSASTNLKTEILEKLNEGGSSLRYTNESLLQLQQLLRDFGGSQEKISTGKKTDIWSKLDGQLGVIGI